MIPCHRTSFSISSINLLHSCPSAIHKNNIVITTNMMRIQFLNFFNEKSNSFARFFAVSYFKWFLFVQTLTQHSTVSIIELLDVRVLYSTHLNLLNLSLPCITKFCTWGYVEDPIWERPVAELQKKLRTSILMPSWLQSAHLLLFFSLNADSNL